MRWLLFSLGWFFFVLGIVGAFIPILPTTPFLLLSALLFSKSSPRFHRWLLELPIAGEGIRDWNENRVIRPRAKILCTLMILLSLIIIWLKVQLFWPIKFIISFLLISVNLFVLTRKSS